MRHFGLGALKATGGWGSTSLEAAVRVNGEIYFVVAFSDFSRLKSEKAEAEYPVLN